MNEAQLNEEQELFLKKQELSRKAIEQRAEAERAFHFYLERNRQASVVYNQQIELYELASEAFAEYQVEAGMATELENDANLAHEEWINSSKGSVK